MRKLPQLIVAASLAALTPNGLAQTTSTCSLLLFPEHSPDVVISLTNVSGDVTVTETVLGADYGVLKPATMGSEPWIAAAGDSANQHWSMEMHSLRHMYRYEGVQPGPSVFGSARLSVGGLAVDLAPDRDAEELLILFDTFTGARCKVKNDRSDPFLGLNAQAYERNITRQMMRLAYCNNNGIPAHGRWAIAITPRADVAFSSSAIPDLCPVAWNWRTGMC